MWSLLMNDVSLLREVAKPRTWVPPESLINIFTLSGLPDCNNKWHITHSKFQRED